MSVRAFARCPMCGATRPRALPRRKDDAADAEREAFEAYSLAHPEILSELEAAARFKVGLAQLGASGRLAYLEKPVPAPSRGRWLRLAAVFAAIALFYGAGLMWGEKSHMSVVDYWRWWVMANVPESSDATFGWEQFQAQVNADLADVLGNFVNRVTKLCVARFDGQMPGEGEYGEDEKTLIAELDRRIAQYAAYMEDAEFRKAMGEMRAIWVAGNEYMTRAAPWTHIKTDRAKAAVGVRMGLNLVHQFAHLLDVERGR